MFTTRLLVRALPLAVVASLTFAVSAAAESPIVNTPASITGNAVVGEQLTAHNGTWLYGDATSCRSECTMSYQWQRCDAGGGNCADISGATGRFYTVQAADAGSRLRAMETMSNEDCSEWNYSTGTRECRVVSKSAPSAMTAVVGGGSGATAPAAPTPPAAPTVPAGPPPAAPLAPTPSAAPEISGLPMVDETLSATKGRWSGTGALALNLEWLRCDADGQNCAGLGITADAYHVIAVDVGKTLRVRVTAASPYGAGAALSQATAVVSELKPTEAKPWIPAAKVMPPHKLQIALAAVAPQRLTRRVPIRLSLTIVDTRGFRVSGALVSVVALPAVGFLRHAAVQTDETGLAKLTLIPTKKLDLRKTKTVTLVVNARRPGDRVTSPRAAVVRLAVRVAGR